MKKIFPTKNSFLLKILLFLALVGIFFWPLKTLAADFSANEDLLESSVTPGDILITEVEYNPPQSGTDTKYEWVEIYNNSGQDLLLENWKFEDSSSFDIIPTFSLKDSEFLVIAATKEGFEENFGDKTPTNFVIIADGKIGNGLSNSGDTLNLYTPGISDLINSVEWKNSDELRYLLVVDGYSIERIPYDGDFYSQKHPSPGLSPFFLEDTTNIKKDSLILSWQVYFSDFEKYEVYRLEEDNEILLFTQNSNIGQTSILIKDLACGTVYQFFIRVYDKLDFAGDSNIISATTDFDRSGNIIISELMPAPISGPENEWIEIYNKGTTTVDLSGWLLDDGNGGSSPWPIPAGTKIPVGRFLVFYKSQTKITLNDSGDLAQLFWPNLQLISRCSVYNSAPKGQSWARNNSAIWQWTQTPTPGAKNIITKSKSSATEPVFLSIDQAKKLAKGSLVTVEGIVTVLPGSFSNYYFYLQDVTSGIKIYFSKVLSLKLQLGDKFQITGEISESSGELRIKIRNPADIVFLSHYQPPEPVKIKTGQAENFAGQLAIVTGRVVETSGSTFYLDDGSGKIKIYISSKTGIKKPKMSRGDLVTIIGVISRTKSGFRIMPRFQSDIIVKSKGELVKTKVQDSALENLLGVSKAEAAAQVLGQDFRVKADNRIRNFGWMLITVGFGLLIIFYGIIFWRKRWQRR